MIVGCYVLDLYCDRKGCLRRSKCTHYTAPSGMGARNQARRDGWKVEESGERDVCLCPSCNPDKKRSKKK